MTLLALALLGLALPALRVAPLLWLATRALSPLRSGLLVAVAIALVVGMRAGVGALPLDAWLLVAALRELALGVALALVLGAPLVAVSVAGQWVDRPWSSGDGPIARLLSLVAAMTLLASGAHRGVTRALAVTYAVLPVTAREWSVAASWPAATGAVAAGLSAASTLAASVLLAVLAVELTVAVAGRVGAPWERAEVRVPAREVALLGAVAVSLGAWTGAVRSMAATALEAVAALR